MSRQMIRGLVLSAVVAGAAGAQGADPKTVQPERPTVATHAGTVAKGYAELEWGVDAGEFVTSIPLYLKIGLGERLQFGLLVPPFKPKGGDFDIGSTGVALKWRLLDDHKLLGKFAVQPGVTFPSGGGDPIFNAWLISSHELGNVAMDLNVNVTSESGNAFDTWTASFGGPFTEQWGWVFEVFGQPNVGSDMSILVGPTYRLKNSFSLDAGVISSKGAGTRYYFGGVTNFGKLIGR